MTSDQWTGIIQMFRAVLYWQQVHHGTDGKMAAEQSTVDVHDAIPRSERPKWLLEMMAAIDEEDTQP